MVAATAAFVADWSESASNPCDAFVWPVRFSRIWSQ
jgi:hypothetical protein